MRRMFAFLALAVSSGQAPARADDYHVTVFAAEAVPFRSTHTHTFIVVTRIPDAVPGVVPALESHTISWYPADLDLRGVTVLPEQGRNLSVAETFAECCKNGMRVCAWGPFRIEAALFEVMKAQEEHLTSGKVKYKPTDNFYHSDCACNCYHAIWRPIAPCRKYSGVFNCGGASGSMTLRLFTPWLIRPEETHDWLLPLIVPAGVTYQHRDYRDRPNRLDAIRSSMGR
jgi:hypothetical protein